MSISGGTLGLVLGGLATEHGTWRWTMFEVPIELVVLLLARRTVTETPRRPGRRHRRGRDDRLGTQRRAR
ncbi:hypothetical protein [Nonomuraea sp. NPDC003804]|uniref:hypothetical protein n=1 Tax=Nonomuraea sp. NPDC003804 TaxID=3154547 RepID=UPI0033B12527